jgi:hypothetical protein
MLRIAREFEAKIKAGKTGKWAVGDGAYLQVAKVAKRSTASWLFRFDSRSMGWGRWGW